MPGSPHINDITENSIVQKTVCSYWNVPSYGRNWISLSSQIATIFFFKFFDTRWWTTWSAFISIGCNLRHTHVYTCKTHSSRFEMRPTHLLPQLCYFCSLTKKKFIDFVFYSNRKALTLTFNANFGSTYAKWSTINNIDGDYLFAFQALASFAFFTGDTMPGRLE